MTPLSQSGNTSSWQRKLFATLAVAMVVGLTQLYIFWRTKPPEPTIPFPTKAEEFAR